MTKSVFPSKIMDNQDVKNAEETEDELEEIYAELDRIFLRRSLRASIRDWRGLQEGSA